MCRMQQQYGVFCVRKIERDFCRLQCRSGLTFRIHTDTEPDSHSSCIVASLREAIHALADLFPQGL